MGWGVHVRAREEHIPRVLHIEEMPIPDKLVIPVSQHIGAPAKPVVKVGDEVSEGQLIAESSGKMSSNIHSSAFGKVISIQNLPTTSGKKQECIIIETDERNFEDNKKNKPAPLAKSDALKMIESAGIVGMGGAMFPSHIKLNPPKSPKSKSISTLIINGCECEPYLSSDAALMYHESTEIIKGAKIMMRVLNAKKTIIAIEDDKKESILVMNKALSEAKDNKIEIRVIETKYPQGAEKNLIKEITGEETPSGKLPLETGCVVHNVATAKAVSDAVNQSKPLTERILTVSGPSIKTRILKVKTGTLFSDILAFCEIQDAEKLISGGPMMGVAQYTAEVPVVKGTSGILIFTKKDLKQIDGKQGDGKKEKPCIRCAKCIDKCPANLMPNMLAKKSKHEIYDPDSLDCVECGVCSYVCPSNIPLVSWIRLAKSEINKQNRKTK